MTFAYFFLLYLFPLFIHNMEECVSVISLQLLLLPFSPSAILVSPIVYTSIMSPVLPLSIESSKFVYLS